MDQIKIGAFIAANRKEHGLTQVQLAEQLGVSNKSVSKWERGVCLPDVSLYQPLCGILDITLNEFFAGEKLSEEMQIQQTEKTIMEVSMKGKREVGKLKKWLIAAGVIALVAVLGVLYFFYKAGGFYQDMIWKASVRSGEMQVAEMAAGTDGILLYNWKADQAYQYVRLDLSYYEGGALVGEPTSNYMILDRTGRDHSGKLLLQRVEGVQDAIQFALSYEGGSFGGPIEVQEPSYYEKTRGGTVEVSEAYAAKSKIQEASPLTIGTWQFADDGGTEIGEILVTATFFKERPEGI